MSPLRRLWRLTHPRTARDLDNLSARIDALDARLDARDAAVAALARDVSELAKAMARDEGGRQ